MRQDHEELCLFPLGDIHLVFDSSKDGYKTLNILYSV